MKKFLALVLALAMVFAFAVTAHADDAKAAYKSLNREVSVNGKVVIDEYTALRGAMNGVKEAGNLSIDILKQQKQAATEAAQALEKKHGFEALTADMDAAEKKWAESIRKIGETTAESARQAYNVWRNETTGFWTNVDDEFSAGWSKITNTMSKNWKTNLRQMEVELAASARRMEQALKNALNVKGSVQIPQGRRWGGLVGEISRYARGGKLAGYGGGDRIPALLESGEFVIRKEAVRKFGAGMFNALNNLRLPELPDLSVLLPRVPQAAAAAPGRTVNINLTLPSGDTYQMTTDERTAARIEREQERWWNLRSSNKVRRGDFARTR